MERNAIVRSIPFHQSNFFFPINCHIPSYRSGIRNFPMKLYHGVDTCAKRGNVISRKLDFTRRMNPCLIPFCGVSNIIERATSHINRHSNLTLRLHMGSLSTPKPQVASSGLKLPHYLGTRWLAEWLLRNLLRTLQTHRAVL